MHLHTTGQHPDACFVRYPDAGFDDDDRRCEGANKLYDIKVILRFAWLSLVMKRRLYNPPPPTPFKVRATSTSAVRASPLTAFRALWSSRGPCRGLRRKRRQPRLPLPSFLSSTPAVRSSRRGAAPLPHRGFGLQSAIYKPQTVRSCTNRVHKSPSAAPSARRLSARSTMEWTNDGYEAVEGQALLRA